MEEFGNINWAIILPVLILQFALTIAALVSCLSQEMTKEKRLMWILIIIFINIIGPILYFVFGRRQ
jgi:heme/copper-type cytochrome/quinol oxidase subunit 4